MIIKVWSHQYCLLAGGYNLEIGHFYKWLDGGYLVDSGPFRQVIHMDDYF